MAKSKDNKFIQGLVGFLIILLFGFAYNDDFGTFVMLSVICTFGLMLPVYVLASLIVGKIAYFIVKQPDKKDKKIQLTVHHQEALVKFIIQARQKTMSDHEIAKQLKNQGGWKDKDIKQAFDSIETLKHNNL